MEENEIKNKKHIDQLDQAITHYSPEVLNDFSDNCNDSTLSQSNK